MITAAVVVTTDVIKQDANIDYKSSVSEVDEGSTVSSVFLNVQVIGKVAAGGVDNVYMAVVKNPGNQIIFPNVSTLGTSVVRKFVLHQEMIMTTPQATNENNGFPRTMFKGVIRIPPRLRRFGVDDKLSVLLQHRAGEATQTTNWCLQCIYKEFK